MNNQNVEFKKDIQYMNYSEYECLVTWISSSMNDLHPYSSDEMAFIKIFKTPNL